MLSDECAGWLNQAALATLKKTSLCFGYENQFSIPGMGLAALCLNLPAYNGTFGFTCSYFGISTYNELMAGLAYGHDLGKYIHAGIGIHYMTIHQYSGYTDFRAIIPSLGIQVLPVSSITIGLHVFNPGRQSYVPLCSKEIPVIIRCGIGYHPDNNMLICAEYMAHFHQKPFLSAGAEYIFKKAAMIRFGFSSAEQGQYSFGIGLNIVHLRLNLSAIHHQVLGFSPAIAITWSGF
jgi:hypothetical protein